MVIPQYGTAIIKFGSGEDQQAWARRRDKRGETRLMPRYIGTVLQAALECDDEEGEELRR